MSDKTSHQELIEQIAGDFNTYLKKGVRFGSILGDSEPTLEIHDIDTLLKIYFLLATEDDFQEIGPTAPSTSVREFLDTLSEELETLPTGTARESSFTRHIEGRVDWNETQKKRLRRNPADSTHYEVQTYQESYSDDSNLVLKSLLDEIKTILDGPLSYAVDQPDKYDWIGEWGRSTAETFQEDIMDNIHVQRIDTDEIGITERMLKKAGRSRHQIYRDAAELLGYLRRLLRYDIHTTEVHRLLQILFIAPDDDDTKTLFELYWVFRVLDWFSDPTFNLITAGTNTVAEWEADGKTYRMLHNSSGSDAVSFRLTNEDLESEAEATAEMVPFGYLRRRMAVMENKRDIATQAFDTKSQLRQWQGRPDLLLEEHEGDELTGVLIGEVKYTNKRSTAVGGLEELLEYLYLGQGDNEYLMSDSGSSLNWVHGGLFVDESTGVSGTYDSVTVLETNENIPESLFGS
ncbi:hypothetical protein EGH24_12410 [Halonotius terrestris]|uniref:Uncharacterized protein n=1 Tax=Halonotius terrestris TaxID=2487750 RepID=A0A8J8PAM4_9EURY|nr:hypothetical protein [Halonotius terrestris]TQQ79187.1 hypothetical protein EGH24_12410 [Halonotius terrestris]